MIHHLMSILISIFLSGYHGKTTDFVKNSSCHRTTIVHFLNYGKWDESLLSDTLKRSVIEIIYSEAARIGKPVFCIVDDTIASRQSLRHRLCIRLKMRIFINLIWKGNRTMGIRQFRLCIPVTALFWITLLCCITSRFLKLALSRISQKSCQSHR